MTGVTCLGGQTQIGRVLSHVRGETDRGKVDAVIFVGDAFEEDIDAVCHAAGELGVLGVPVFVFHERSEEHTSELQSLMRISYAVFCLKKKRIYQQRPKRK